MFDLAKWHPIPSTIWLWQNGVHFLKSVTFLKGPLSLTLKYHCNFKGLSTIKIFIDFRQGVFSPELTHQSLDCLQSERD